MKIERPIYMQQLIDSNNAKGLVPVIFLYSILQKYK